MRYEAADKLEGLRYGVAAPPIPKPPVFKAPSYEKIHQAYQERMGPYVDPQVISLLADAEYNRQRTAFAQAAVPRDIPAIAALATLAKQTPAGQFSSRVDYAYDKGIAPARVAGASAPTTGSGKADAVADTIGSLSATSAKFAAAQAATGGAAKVLGKVPQLAKAAQLAPSAVRAATRGAATGGAYSGIQAATGHPVTAKDVARQMAFSGGAGAGSALTKGALQAFAPGMPLVGEAALTGLGAGVGAAAAAYPLSESRGVDYLKESAIPIASMVLLHSVYAALSPEYGDPKGAYAERWKRTVSSLRRVNEAATTGDESLLRATQRDYWEAVNEAYSAARRVNVNLPPRITDEMQEALVRALEYAVTGNAPSAGPTPTATPAGLPAPKGEVAPVPQTAPVSPAQTPIVPPVEPVEAPVTPKPVKKGATSVAKTDKGTEVHTQFALVNLPDLVVSHDPETMAQNPQYPQELQPRDRTRAATNAQMAHIVGQFDPRYLGESIEASGGSPIVSPDMVVESGNVRSMVLSRIYAKHPDKAEAYKEWLAQTAPQYGFTAEDVASMDKPVLVRIRQSDVDLGAFVSEANVASVATMSATEQAMADAARLTGGLLARFSPDEEGEILTAANRAFIGDFLQNIVGPSTMGSYLTPDGSLSQDGVNRIRNAVFAKAYGDPSNLEKMAESTDNNIRNISGAMLIAAPRYADVQERISQGNLHPISLAEDVTSAANKLAALRRQGTTVKTFLSQATIFGDGELTPEAERLLELFDQYGRSRKRLAMLLNASVDAIEAAGVPGQMELFGGSVVPTKMEVVEAAVRKVARQYGEIGEDQGGLFEPSEAATAQAGDTTVGSGDAVAAYGAAGEGTQEAELAPALGTRASVGRYFIPPDQERLPGQEGEAKAPEEVEPDKGGPWTFARTIAGKTKIEDFHPLEGPELAEMVEMLSGQMPRIREQLREAHGQALGVFKERGDEGSIELRADIFLGPEVASMSSKPLSKEAREAAIEEFRTKVAQEAGLQPDDLVVRWSFERKTRKLVLRAYQPNSNLAPRVLAHEIGHLIDWLPDKELGRGNILGHIATLKNWLKTTIGELPASPDDFLTPEQREAIHKSLRKAMKGAPADKIKNAYTKAIEDEITKRGLVARDEIMDELKTLTQRWKPFDPAQSEEYTKYRHSPEELYADAISVLFNDPQQFVQVAPKTASMVVNYSDRKPAVREALEKWQGLYADRQSLLEHRGEGLAEMWEHGDRRLAEAKAEGERKTEAAADWLIRGLWDADWAINKGQEQRIRGSDKHVSKIAQEAAWSLEEARYIDSKVNVLLNDFQTQVLSVLEEAGLSNHDAGTVMFLNRVLGDRSTLANPLGHTPSSASEQLEYLRDVEFGPEKYEAAQQALKAFRDIRETVVFPFLEEANFFKQEDIDSWKENSSYARFNVQKFLDEKLGKEASAHVYHQIGTMSEVVNPVVSTLMQDISFIRIAKMNEAKRALRRDLSNVEGGWVPAKMRWSGDAGRRVPVEPDDPDLALFPVITAGETQWAYVDRGIAEAFKHDPVRANTFVETLDMLTGVLKEIYAGKNPVWQVRNIPRDIAGTILRLPQMKLRDAPKLLATYIRTLPEVLSYVFGQEMSEDLREAFDTFAITPGRIYAPKDASFKDEIERLLSEYMINRPEDGHDTRAALRLVKAAGKMLDQTGQASELWGKLSSYKFLKEEMPDIGARERAHFTRSHATTPDFKHRAAWQDWLDKIFLFYGINKEGWRATGSAFKDNPGRFMWKLFNLSILPKLIQYGVLYFAAGTQIREVYRKMNRYDRKHYAILPIGIINDGKDAVYLRIPQDYATEAVGAVLDDVLSGRLVGQDGAVSTAASSLPFNLNPVLDLAWKGFQIYAMGLNPEDRFYGSPVLSDLPENLGAARTAREVAAYTWNQLGGTAIYRARRGPQVLTEDTEIQKLLRMPGFNLLGTFLRISRDGEMSEAYDITGKVALQEKREQISRREATIQAVNAGLTLEQTYGDLVKRKLINPATTSVNQFKTTYDRYAIRTSENHWDRAVINASTVRQRKALLDAMPEEERRRFAGSYNLATGEKRTTSTPSLRGVKVPKF